MNYDARGDAEMLASSLIQWSKLGFLRGFAGMLYDLSPKDRMILPSAAFHEAAAAAIGEQGDMDENEYRARVAYVEEVETILHRIQSEVIADHYSKANKGWAVDLAMGWMIVLLAAISWYHVGIEHPMTISILVLLSIVSVIVQIFARRRIADAMKAFKTESSDITMPWQS